MKRRSQLSTEELKEKLADVDGKKPALRLIVAINYKEGISQTTIANWYGLSRKTIYNWLHRLDSEPLDRALHDESSPGRPPKLDDCEATQLETILKQAPTEVGYDASEWTPELVGHYIEETFGIEYSIRSLRRIIDTYGPS